MNDKALRAIQAGDTAAYVSVIAKLARSVTDHFPKPDGSGWTPEDIEDLISSFYVSAAYQHSVLNAHDDDSLRSLVYTGLANIVRAGLRRTERGRLHRRIKDLISKEGFVEGPKKFWRRENDPADPSMAEQSDLLCAAWKIEVQVVRWRHDAKRSSPVAELTSLLALLDAIFDHANGAVHMDVLVEVLGSRLGVGPVTATEDLDTTDDRYLVASQPDPGDHLIDREKELDAAIEAVGIWGQLSPNERRLVPHLASSSRAAAAAVGGGKSAVNEAMQRLKEKFRVLMGDAVDVDDRRRVLHELLVLSGTSEDS